MTTDTIYIEAMTILDAQYLAEELREADFFSQQCDKLDKKFEKLVDWLEASPDQVAYDIGLKAIQKTWPQFNY